MPEPNDWGNLRFQRRRRPENDSPDWVKWVLIAVAAIAVAMLLIEWNARRQAAASVNEWTRPMTPEERAKFDEWLREEERQADAALERIWQQPAPPRPRSQPRPLAAGERCISHQRFRRVENGWVQIGSC